MDAKAKSPFSIAFGKKPNEYISRVRDENEIIDAFMSESTNAYMISGVRGSGKTVLLSDIANRLDEEGWVVVELNPTTDMRMSLASKLYNKENFTKDFINAKLNLSLLGIGMTIENSPPISDIDTATEKMLKVLKKKEKKLLVVVDEVTNNREMRQFASSFQMFIRSGFQIYLLMTGLYNNLRKLQNDDEITFLLRTPQIILEPLRLSSIKKSYKDALGIGEEIAEEMAKLTRGYAYAYQVLGYLYWKEQPGENINHILPEYDAYLYDYVYDKIWAELSENDKMVAKAIAEHGGNAAVNVIREELDMSDKYFSVYRDRAKKKGIIDTSTYAKLSFSLPRFEEYVIDRS